MFARIRIYDLQITKNTSYHKNIKKARFVF